MSRPLALLLTLMVPATASAWNPLDPKIVWFPSDMPIPFEISDYEEDSLDPGRGEEAVLTAFARWEAAECARMEISYEGLVSENTGFQRADGVNRVNWDDPDDELAVGVLAAASPFGSTSDTGTRTILGDTYRHITDGDVVYNDGVNWIMEEDLDTCVGQQYSVVAVGVHEYGHWWGLGHTCEETDSCPDASDRQATMYYSIGPCQNGAAFPTQNDLDGVTALYGPSTRIQCSHELQPGEVDTIAVGVIPMEIRCVVTDRGNDTFSVTDASWYFGDGTENEVGLEVSHTYTEAGNYSVQASVTGISDTCGEWDVTVSRPAYVRACGVPDVDLAVSHIDGRQYQLLNQTDLSVIGCIFDVQWDIFDDSGLVDSLETWEPEYEFPANGDYRIVLNVGGPAGTAAAELNVKVRNRRGSGYSTCDSIGTAALSPLFLMLPLAIRRRRE